jgi:hypothetical protein
MAEQMTHCLICGRPCPEQGQQYVRFNHVQQRLAQKGDHEEDVSLYRVGRDCYRRLTPELRVLCSPINRKER